MKETVDEIRDRLSRDSRIIQAIEQRAYEIWVLRGRQHGRAEEDWRLAENEVIGFLIEQELRAHSDIVPAPEEAIEVTEIVVVSTPLDITPEPIPEADIIIAPAPVIATPETAGEPPRKRAAAKSGTKSTAGRKPRAAKEGEEQSTAAKRTTKKPAAKKTAGKKSAKTEQPTVD